MAITKEEFCKIIERLRKNYDRQTEIDDVLDTIIDFEDVSDVVINLLEKIMGIEADDFWGSDISYFCYELDFGRAWTPDSITDTNGNSIDISTAEKLYDYLTS